MYVRTVVTTYLARCFWIAVQEVSMQPNSLINEPKFRESLRKVLTDAVTSMKAIDHHKYFHDPVTDDEAPEYSTVITNPMCLSMMELKVTSSQYKTPEEFEADVSS